VEVTRHEFVLKPHQELIIAPIGDIQWAGDKDAIAYQHLVRHLKRCRKLKAWYLGMGDYTDFASPSNRQTLRNGKLYDTAREVIQNQAKTLTIQLYEDFLIQTEGRWIGMLSGHHFYPVDGWSTDQLLASLLQAPYLGTCALVELDIQVYGVHRSLWIWCHHGNGNGGAAAPIRKLESLSSYWEADIMVIGHMTKLAAAPINRIRGEWGRDGPDLSEKRITLVGNGGWSKGYQLGQQHYPEVGMYRPVSLGGALIRIWGWIDDDGELQLEHRAEV
jgi:hypothetical protein